jgi:hypothetical protein
MKIEGSYKFDDKPWKEFLVAMKQFCRESIVVGIVGDGANDTHPTGHGDLQVWEIAALQEFGDKSGHIPPRPFIKNAMSDTGMVVRVLGEAARRVVHKYSTPRQALKRAGETFADAVRGSLLGGTPPPNKQATIDWKGHADTLIGLTGALYDAIGYAIRGNDA